jgi:uncharacterized protein Smg (DUF494 family)
VLLLDFDNPFAYFVLDSRSSMQERIIEILVYLLSELHHERAYKNKVNLTNALVLKGYTETEINLAFAWIFNHLRRPIAGKGDSTYSFTEDMENYPDADQLILSPEAYGYLLHLLDLGIIRDNDVEMFVERALAYGKDAINVDDLKSIVATIIFGMENRSSFNGYPMYQEDLPIQ